MRVRAGVACRDITPPTGLAMSGYGVRTRPARGAHAPLTVRALAIDDTALVVADVIGIEAAVSARIRARCALDGGRVVVAALHTHGGPASMTGRLGDADPRFLARLEAACVEAIDAAAAAARPAVLSFGEARGDVGRNRRRADGPVDPALPVLAVRGEDGRWIAVLTSYACHPVVLGPDNLLWTADYPHFLRARVEQRCPGTLCLFATACCGDVNTGHTPESSFRAEPTNARTCAAAARVGHRLADALLAAELEPVAEGAVGAAAETVPLTVAREDAGAVAAMRRGWLAQRASAGDAAEPALVDGWIAWAEAQPEMPDAAVPARVTALAWGGLRVVALPGEIFARTGLEIRRSTGRPLILVGYADDNPGYIAPAGEFRFGGYEIDTAHRLYGFPGPFAPGCAEHLEAAARRCLGRLE